MSLTGNAASVAIMGPSCAARAPALHHRCLVRRRRTITSMYRSLHAWRARAASFGGAHMASSFGSPAPAPRVTDTSCANSAARPRLIARPLRTGARMLNIGLGDRLDARHADCPAASATRRHRTGARPTTIPSCDTYREPRSLAATMSPICASFNAIATTIFC